MSKAVVKDSYIDSRGNIVTRRANGTLDVLVSFANDPGLTEQNHIDECDLTTIVNRYARAGQPILIPQKEFTDLTNLPDYQDSLNAVFLVDKLFSSLPIAVKQAYNQEPSLFMKALTDPSQKDKLIALGVFEAPVDVPVLPTTPPSDGG